MTSFRKLLIFFPNIDLHEYTNKHKYRVRKGEAFFTHGVFLGKNKKEILANVNVVPTFYEEGEAYVIFHDNTKKIINGKALKASERKYKDIFENSHEAIIYVDLKKTQGN